MYDLKIYYVNLGLLVTSPHLSNCYVGLTRNWLFDYFFVEEKGKETEPDGYAGLSREDMLWTESI